VKHHVDPCLSWSTNSNGSRNRRKEIRSLRGRSVVEKGNRNPCCSVPTVPTYAQRPPSTGHDTQLGVLIARTRGYPSRDKWCRLRNAHTGYCIWVHTWGCKIFHFMSSTVPVSARHPLGSTVTPRPWAPQAGCFRRIADRVPRFVALDSHVRFREDLVSRASLARGGCLDPRKSAVLAIRRLRRNIRHNKNVNFTGERCRSLITSGPLRALAQHVGVRKYVSRPCLKAPSTVDLPNADVFQ
jgi:hypothetical protein